MYRETPDQRLWLAKQRQSELINEAHEYRLARAGSRDVADRRPGRIARFAGWLGSSIGAVRRASAGYETAPCTDACLDCDPC
jgi:hypothetical protein